MRVCEQNPEKKVGTGAQLLTFYGLCPFLHQTVSQTVCRFADRCKLPAQHWQSIRTSNPIESAFATISHRTKRTKGCLSRDGMPHIPPIALLLKTAAGQWMFKLGQCGAKGWRKPRGFAHLADVIEGVDLGCGIKPLNQD